MPKEYPPALRPSTCSIPDCSRPLHRRGWCNAHYHRWQRHGDPLGGGPPAAPKKTACSIEGCTYPIGKNISRGWCATHYKRWKAHGDPLEDGITPLPIRFWSKVDQHGPEVKPGLGPCWLWTGYINPNGYGDFFLWTGKHSLAHTVSFELSGKVVPPGLELDHVCRVRACVNPSHLEPVTHHENVRRGDAGWNTREKTHCPKGHPYTPDNVTLEYRANGLKARHCKACPRERYHAQRAAMKQERGDG